MNQAPANQRPIEGQPYRQQQNQPRYDGPQKIAGPSGPQGNPMGLRNGGIGINIFLFQCGFFIFLLI